jgi:hypothetical protein
MENLDISVAIADQQQIIELPDVQLAVVGGGVADVTLS